ncbi:hypothetical protein QUW03_07820 [Faecalicoccus acidiformans]|uniref:hypothetical protein n=1 Tax=Faecalicoccus acidiformans TaxID=915173 RepID=UPI0025A47635|nr:hypothetical protein [Faecalicoccus acidiformans]MDM8204275.1 hypothetical protein [Faecalicoccus acidiformans]
MNFSHEILDDVKVNVEYAKDQEEYQTLPVHRFKDGMICGCIVLDDNELEAVLKEGKIYFSILTFNQPLQPFFITTDKNLFKEHIDVYQNKH